MQFLPRPFRFRSNLPYSIVARWLRYKHIAMERNLT